MTTPNTNVGEAKFNAPWKWVYPKTDNGFVIDWKDEFYEGELPYIVDETGETVMHFGDTTQYYPSCGGFDHDLMSLVISAPQMFEALEKCFDFISATDLPELHTEIRHVLALARGEAHGTTGDNL